MGTDLNTSKSLSFVASQVLAAFFFGACSTVQRPPKPAAASAPAPAPLQTEHDIRFGPLGADVGASTSPRSEQDQAALYYKKGDFKRAVFLLSDAVRKDESNAVLWRNLGSAYAMDNDIDNAVLCFQRSVAHDPSDSRSFYDLSIVEGWKGSLVDAEQAAQRGLILDPAHGGLHSSLGNVYDDEGKEDQALTQYAVALTINAGDTVTRFNRGGLYFKLRKLGAAETDFNRVLKLAPNDLEAAQNLAAVYILQGRLKAAEILNQWVVRRHPKDEDTLENAYFNLGIIYDRQDRIEHALNMYQLALQVAPWDAAAYVNAAVILEKLNRRSEALAYWEKYQRLFPASRRAKEIDERIKILHKLVALEKAGPSGTTATTH